MRIRVAFLAALVAVAVACGGNSASPSATNSGAAKTTSSSFTRFDGSNASFADYRGTPLVVNFFASWCAPCVREMPDLERVHRDLAGKVAFLGIDVRDSLEDGKKLAEQTGVTYDLARDPRGELLAAIGGVAMPTTAFLDAAGNVKAVQSRAFTAADLRAFIDKELTS